ncbi:MAG: alpha/beta hydrolase [Anaerolineales bacterium]|nr:alpha/beta hydrolase [Anaerolineales bacterium]
MKANYWVRLGIMTVVSLLVMFAVTLVWFSYQQTQNYLHPTRQAVSEGLLNAQGMYPQHVTLTTEDNVKLAAWYTPPQNGAVILVAHGYGDRRSEEYFLLFAQKGYGVLAWDFRAHGQSEGDFSSLGYYEVIDTKAALDFALSQPGVEHIGAWGGSMGAVTMVRATAQYPQIEALVADSPFAALEDEMNLRVTLPPMRPLIRFFAERAIDVGFDRVRPVDEIGKISPRPIFLIQGLADSMVPLDSAQRLFDAASEPRQLWLEEGVGHLGMYGTYEEKYTRQVIGFFDRYLLGK